MFPVSHDARDEIHIEIQFGEDSEGLSLQPFLYVSFFFQCRLYRWWRALDGVAHDNLAYSGWEVV